jgi:hypothetical protein
MKLLRGTSIANFEVCVWNYSYYYPSHPAEGGGPRNKWCGINRMVGSIFFIFNIIY